MPRAYTHLTHDKRCQMYALLKKRFLQKAIASDIQVLQSIISCELRRNTNKPEYLKDIDVSNHNNSLVIGVKRHASNRKR
jgi:IS30 family transposase